MPIVEDVKRNIEASWRPRERFYGAFDNDKNAYVINNVRLTGGAFNTTNIQVKISEVAEDTAAIKLCMYCPISTSRKNRLNMQEFLTYINYGMLLGTFEVKPMFIPNSNAGAFPGGTVRYRRTITIRNADGSGKMLKDSLEIGCDILVAFSDLLSKVATNDNYPFQEILCDIQELKNNPQFQRIESYFDDDLFR